MVQVICFIIKKQQQRFIIKMAAPRIFVIVGNWLLKDALGTAMTKYKNMKRIP